MISASTAMLSTKLIHTLGSASSDSHSASLPAMPTRLRTR